MTNVPQREPPVDGHEHFRCSCTVSLQSLAVVVASLNQVQISLATAQSALQQVSHIVPHAVVVMSRSNNPAPEGAIHEPAPSAISISDSDSDWHPSPSRPSTPVDETPPRTSNANDDRWYVVIKGREPGVFHGSSGLMENVSGIPGGNPERHATESDAREAYDNALRAGIVRRFTLISVPL